MCTLKMTAFVENILLTIANKSWAFSYLKQYFELIYGKLVYVST